MLLLYFYFQTDFKVGSHISAVRQNPSCPSQVGTGGQKNDLKLWDLNRPEEPIFRAKNVICKDLLISLSYYMFCDLSICAAH